MEALCTGITDSRGCKQADYCVAKATGNDGNLCPGVCPASCAADQIQCTLPLDEQGCSLSPTCVAKGQDQNGNACPGVCPTTCPDTEMQCPGGIAANETELLAEEIWKIISRMSVPLAEFFNT